MALVDAATFRRMVALEKKLAQRETLTPEEQAFAWAHRVEGPRLCGCGCGEKLEPRVDGVRNTLPSKGEVNDACHFSAFDEELDRCPVLPPRVRRRA